MNSILTGNTASGCTLNCTVGPDASLTSLGGNLESGTDCGLTAAGDLQSADPLLGLLVDNGGGTDTHAIAPLSPALNAANAQACPATDQRGVARPQGAGRDIGAFELSRSFLASGRDARPAPAALERRPRSAMMARLAGDSRSRRRSPPGTTSNTAPLTAYGSQTAPGTSSGSGPQPVSASVGGPQSNTTYHYRLAFPNAAGGAAGADGTFTTAPLRIAHPPPPVLGRVANAEPVGGRIFVCVDGERARLRALGARSSQIPMSGFVPLEEARQFRSARSSTRGTEPCAWRPPPARGPKTQLGRFSAGIFQMLQSRAFSARGMTELQLKGSSFTCCSPRARVTRAGASQLWRNNPAPAGQRARPFPHPRAPLRRDRWHGLGDRGPLRRHAHPGQARQGGGARLRLKRRSRLRPGRQELPPGCLAE